MKQLSKSVGAVNPHVTFCGNRGRVTASGDPVRWETGRWPSAPAIAPILDSTHSGHAALSVRIIGGQDRHYAEAVGGLGKQRRTWVCLCARCDECCFETPRRSTLAQYYHATIARRKAKDVGPEGASFISSEARQPRRQSCRLWGPTPSIAVRLRSPEPDLPLRPPRPCQRTHGSRPDRPGG